MFRFLRGMKYKTKLSLAMIAIVIVPMLAFCAFYVSTSVEKQRRDLLASYDADIAQGVGDIRDLISVSVQKFNSLDHNAQLQMFLKYPQNADLGNKVDLFYNMNSLYQALAISSQMKDLHIYARNLQDESLSFISSYSQLDGDIRTLAAQGGVNGVVTRYLGSAQDRVSGAGTLHLYKANMGLDGQIIAMQEIVLDFSAIPQMFRYDNLPPGSVLLYVIQGQAPMLLHGEAGSAGVNAAMAAQAAGEGPRGFAVLRYDTGYTASTVPGAAHDEVVAFIPRVYLNAALIKFMLISGAVMLMAVAVVIFVVTTVSRTLTNRLYFLINNINTEVDDLDRGAEAVLLGGDDEFQQINLSFHRLIERIKESYQRMAFVETQKKTIEGELLQELINPHFLYNTLEGVRWAAGDRKTADIVGSMIQYYRIALNKGNAVLRVSQELRLVEEYMKLQRFAYESGFRSDIECDEVTANCQMLKHLLQPIVENAILHGIDKRGSAGFISISGVLREGRLVFCVRDNGVGMEAEKLAELRSSLEEDSGGFGLRNVRRRLRLNYGDQASLAIESDPGLGTTVTLILPSLP